MSIQEIGCESVENNRKAGDLRQHRAHYDATVVIAYYAHFDNRDWGELPNPASCCSFTNVHEKLVS